MGTFKPRNDVWAVKAVERVFSSVTFSLLAFDPETGEWGGGAATGNLCVGAWVLRGKAGVGLSASQGALPSTLWGEDVLDRMASGSTPEQAVGSVTSADPGRGERQLAAIGCDGLGAAFTGDANVREWGHRVGEGLVVAGNMLATLDVIEAMEEAYLAAETAMPGRLIAGLKAGQQAGSDSRGLMSAALLVLARNKPPLSLRVDHSDDPITHLGALYERTEDRAYQEWLARLPTVEQPVP